MAVEMTVKGLTWDDKTGTFIVLFTPEKKILQGSKVIVIDESELIDVKETVTLEPELFRKLAASHEMVDRERKMKNVN